MWNVLLLAALAVTASAEGTNRLGVPSWNEMLTFLMQEDSATYKQQPESGVCRNRCYLEFPDLAEPIIFTDTYIHPNEPCIEYTCTAKGVTEEDIVCKKITCPNGPPYTYHGQCCERCKPERETCEFAEWGEWTQCSRTCGGGGQSRERECCAEEGDFVDCRGSLVDTRTCQEQPCPINCEWEWGEYTDCTASCGGGTSTRYPIVTQEPMHFGRPCPPFVQNNESESVTCNENPCPVDCIWEWGEYDECTKLCGGGTKKRYPEIIQEPMHDGEPCPTFVENNTPEYADCNEHPCSVDCIWEWGEYDECTKSCGGGTKSRYPEIIQEPMHDGKPCPEFVQRKIPEHADCNKDPCPIHCEWTTWSDWSDCTKPCDGGTQTREREKNPPAQHNGRDCVGSNTDERDCNTQECQVECDEGENYCDGECVPDRDRDCIPDPEDNCPDFPSLNQKDRDRDGVGNVCDNCPLIENYDQADMDGDGIGDLCDGDIDDDGLQDNVNDFCISYPPRDDDHDGVDDHCDNCPDTPNYFQDNNDKDDMGDACDPCPYDTKNRCVKNSAVAMDSMTEEEEDNLVAKIMEKLREMYYAN